jgi:ATP-dependent Clp protease adaptor protein ClpS
VKKMMDRHRLSAERKDGDDGGGQSQLVLDSRTKTRKPSMYKVLMMNDDYTPMEFVVHVLQHFFNLSNSQANAIMLNVHRRGIGVWNLQLRGCRGKGHQGDGICETK